MVDTLAIARTRHPGAKHSLDALCTRFGVDRSLRVKHGALIDAQLLAQCYVELTGGRQIGLSLADGSPPSESSEATPRPAAGADADRRRSPAAAAACADARRSFMAHAAFLATHRRSHMAPVGRSPVDGKRRYGA